MKKTIIIILSVAVLLGGVLIFYKNSLTGQNTQTPSQTSQQTNEAQKWKTKTDDQANVTVVVTPLDLYPQSAEWKFDIEMNTHSVELDQDMTKVTVLVDDQGTEYQPLKWDGSTGGHHREGVLTFNQVSPISKSIELKILDVGGVARSFTWQLQ